MRWVWNDDINENEFDAWLSEETLSSILNSCFQHLILGRTSCKLLAECPIIEASTGLLINEAQLLLFSKPNFATSLLCQYASARSASSVICDRKKRKKNDRFLSTHLLSLCFYVTLCKQIQYVMFEKKSIAACANLCTHSAPFRTLPTSNSTPLFNENVHPGHVILSSTILEPIVQGARRKINCAELLLTSAFLMQCCYITSGHLLR
uniref:Uncharacterized protein n=1 Tax=Glossina pallidipes TaxID=7398 RepID=A0A1A9ZLE1_GLOPL